MYYCKNRDRIIEYLNNNPVYTVRKIQRVLNIKSVSTVQHHLKRIKKEIKIKNIFDENVKLKKQLEKCKSIMNKNQLIKMGF